MAHVSVLSICKPTKTRAWLQGALAIICSGIFVGAAPMVLAGQEKFHLDIPLGLDEDSLVIPPDNPLTRSKVQLGKLLFFDTRLSQDNTIACATCHKPELAFTDGQPVSIGIHRRQEIRNAPASINRIFGTTHLWDGQAPTLEEQSVGPFINPVIQGFSTHDEFVRKLQTIKGYQPLFENAFGTPQITIERVGKAIASFQRTLLSGNSPYDRFDYGGEEDALSQGAQRGLKLFLGKARCTRCHSGFNFTDEKFHNLGIDWDTELADLGRYKVTGNSEDIGAFKTPTLREIARTAPYMHDGRFTSLLEVMEFYNQGGIQNPHLDPLMIPLNLTEQENLDLVEFMRSLNGEGWQTSPPQKFPEF